MEKKPLVIITGPTASGKTTLAIQTALKHNCEIISADSMQIYRYMDIGTAKPTITERQGILHHMIDIIDPNVEYNVALYQKDATKLINEIYDKGKIPIVVGGTGLYINSLILPMDFTPASEDKNYRDKLVKIYFEKGKQRVHEMLKQVDSETATRLHPNDTRRIIRALEIYHVTGKTMSDYRQDFDGIKSPYNTAIIGLSMDRKRLYERINTRVDSMISNGLVEEVKELLDLEYNKELTSMQGIGYKQLISYIEGLYTLEESIEEIKKNTRRYAKRQLTWFRRYKSIEWLDMDAISEEERLRWINIHIKKKLAL